MHSQEHSLHEGHGLSGSFSHEEGWTLVKGRKDKKASHKEEKKKEGKAIKKVLCKDKVSSIICRVPSLRTGKKTSSCKSPNFVVPSSIVPGSSIKGALFQVDCHQLFVARNAGLCASPSRCTDSAEVFPRVLSTMVSPSTWRMELVLRFACDDIESAILETSVLVLLRLMADVLKASVLALAALLAVLVATIVLVLLRLLAEVVTTLTFAFLVLLAELVLTPVHVLLRLQVRVVESLDRVILLCICLETPIR